MRAAWRSEPVVPGRQLVRLAKFDRAPARRAVATPRRQLPVVVARASAGSADGHVWAARVADPHARPITTAPADRVAGEPQGLRVTRTGQTVGMTTLVRHSSVAGTGPRRAGERGRRERAGRHSSARSAGG